MTILDILNEELERAKTTRTNAQNWVARVEADIARHTPTPGEVAKMEKNVKPQKGDK